MFGLFDGAMVVLRHRAWLIKVVLVKVEKELGLACLLVATFLICLLGGLPGRCFYDTIYCAPVERVALPYASCCLCFVCSLFSLIDRYFRWAI